MTRFRQTFRLVHLAAVAMVLVSTASSPASHEGRTAAAEVSQSNYVDLMDNWLYTHDDHNRGFGVHHNLARNNIQSLFNSYGWDVELHPFNYSGSTYYNVVATKLGTTSPDEVYIVGAHYDSVNNPGADDNASGVALILETARVLGQYDSDATIRLIAFDREEQGLVGSTAYAGDHQNDDIQAVLSCDMVAYSPDGEGGPHLRSLRGRATDQWARAGAARIRRHHPQLRRLDQPNRSRPPSTHAVSRRRR